MSNFVLIIFGKIFSKLVQICNLGNGSTWPGHIALQVNNKLVSEMLSGSNLKIIVIAGTNGKTTTSRLIRTVLEDDGKKVIHNESGANLMNGIASSLILKADWLGRLRYDFAIFEADENALPQILKVIEPDFVLLLNLFRDQLDRYGEINSIAKKWKDTLLLLPGSTSYILNADDPQIAYLGAHVKGKKYYFGLDSNTNNTIPAHSADSVYCPKCGNKLSFESIAFSHLGKWHCKKCGLKRPEPDIVKFSYYPLPGTYNKYNILASVLTLQKNGLKNALIESSIKKFKPAFGRQEVVNYKGKNIQIFLSKNPTGFNQSYATIKSLGAKLILLVLNDRIPDGRDVSWIWDIDLPQIEQFKHVYISGDRVWDMTLRVKYEISDQNQNTKFKTFEDLKSAIEEGINNLEKDETLYILPTYSAMLEVRKILTGKKIL